MSWTFLSHPVSNDWIFRCNSAFNLQDTRSCRKRKPIYANIWFWFPAKFIVFPDRILALQQLPHIMALLKLVLFWSPLRWQYCFYSQKKKKIQKQLCNHGCVGNICMLFQISFNITKTDYMIFIWLSNHYMGNLTAYMSTPPLWLAVTISTMRWNWNILCNECWAFG